MKKSIDLMEDDLYIGWKSRYLNYINEKDYTTLDELISEVSKILYSFTQSLQ